MMIIECWGEGSSEVEEKRQARPMCSAILTDNATFELEQNRPFVQDEDERHHHRLIRIRSSASA